MTAPKKEMTILTEPIINVFLNANQNLGSSKTAIKLEKPTNLEPKIPTFGLNHTLGHNRKQYRKLSLG